VQRRCLSRDRRWPRVCASVEHIVFASDRRSNRSIGEVAEKLGVKTIFVGTEGRHQPEIAGTIFANIAWPMNAARAI